MEKPEKPLPSECCGGGACCPCVWDAYFEKLEAWQKLQEPSGSEKSDQNKSSEHQFESDDDAKWFR